jgi:hypothetical protein
MLWRSFLGMLSNDENMRKEILPQNGSNKTKRDNYQIRKAQYALSKGQDEKI